MRYVCIISVVVLLGSYPWPAPPAAAVPLVQLVQDDFSTLPPPRGIAPLRAVLAYLRYYESQPARVLPYITEHFRSGMEPRVWVDQTRALLAAQGYTRLSWTVHRLEMSDTEATVYVTTRARIDGQELVQQEIFALIHTPEGEWLINDWQLE